MSWVMVFFGLLGCVSSLWNGHKRAHAEKLLICAWLLHHGEAYGNQIAEATDINLGRLHALLMGLERSGALTARFGEPTPERGNRRRRYYAVAK